MLVKLSDGSVMAAGTVTKDAELKTVGEKKSKVTSFSIAAGKRKDTTTIFVTIKAWGRLAYYSASALKGDPVFAVGHIESREYNGKTYDDLVCEFISISGSRAIPHQTEPVTQTPSVNIYDFADEVEEPGDLPF